MYITITWSVLYIRCLVSGKWYQGGGLATRRRMVLYDFVYTLKIFAFLWSLISIPHNVHMTLHKTVHNWGRVCEGKCNWQDFFFLLICRFVRDNTKQDKRAVNKYLIHYLLLPRELRRPTLLAFIKSLS